MSAHAPQQGRPLTIRQLVSWKASGRKIVCATAYDYTMARLVDQAGVDLILVGDSLGNVVQGHDTTIPVTVDDIIYHARAVRRAITRPHLVSDLPFMAYSISVEDGMRNAARLMQEGGVHSVKIEGGREHAELVHRLVQAGVPVMAHLGLTPQSVHQLGGYRVQGRDADGAMRILEDAKILEDAGAYAVVLECVPEGLAHQVSTALQIPTIGIGAGPQCDGQILVLHDLLGLNLEFKPKFVRRFAELGQLGIAALETYAESVREGSFPALGETFDPEPPVAWAQ
ncbi:MAG: 3-methyl-2-oxobutanoate hydroxymethyltransferase [Myxococcales bacterium]|nr:3-methyl-2-oxobutanoate hydroxymethyltransferase [Myxococcales bacterium]